MATSYDQIYQTFLNNCKVSDIDLPQTNDAIYEVIKNAVMYYNNRLREPFAICDDNSETINQDLDDDHLLILAHYIRYNFLVNQRTYFESLWQPFEKDVGLKNFTAQLNSLKASVTEESKIIDRLIMNMEVDYL